MNGRKRNGDTGATYRDEIDDINRRRKELEEKFGSEEELRARRRRNEYLTADEIIALIELDGYYWGEHGEWPDDE